MKSLEAAIAELETFAPLEPQTEAEIEAEMLYLCKALGVDPAVLYQEEPTN